MGDVRFCGILMIWLVLYNDSFSGSILVFTKGSPKGQLGSRSNTAKQEFFLLANKQLSFLLVFFLKPTHLRIFLNFLVILLNIKYEIKS